MITVLRHANVDSAGEITKGVRITDPNLNEPLLRSARKWLVEAMGGWLATDHAKVVTLAPIAVEHLAKAALWTRNPVLLAQLSQTHERSFMLLATGGDLNDPGLRTIGLAEALDRVATVYGSALPLDSKRKRRLIECRGGAVHVGQFTNDSVRHVLTDVLSLFQWIAGLLDISPALLFGMHTGAITNLLDERRSDTQRSVDRKLDAARFRLVRLAESVGDDLLPETVAQKEAATLDQLPRLISMESVAVMRKCPACGHQAAVLGDLEQDPVVDVEGGHDEVTYNVGVNLYLIPDSLYCHVCGLTLLDTQELELCSVAHEKFLLTADEITDELIEYADAQNEWLRDQSEMYMEEQAEAYREAQAEAQMDE